MKHIAVIFGGRSAEHDVSIVTAIASIIKPLQLKSEYKIEPIYISKAGDWYWSDKLVDIALYQSGDITEFIKNEPKVQLLFDNGLILIKPLAFKSRKKTQKIDIVFPAMHGTHGEDGELMGLLQMANVPYIGCGLEASVISMNKITSKQVTAAAGIVSTPWVWVSSDELANDIHNVLKRIEVIAYPLFVKPAHLGSSIGITRVQQYSELVNALEVAAHYDNQIIIEQGVQNLVEVTLPVIGNDILTPAYLEQALTKANDFFDFQSKYIIEGGKKNNSKGDTKEYSNIPADLSPSLYRKTQQTALDVYRAIGCSGIARIDMLIDSKTKKVYFNEINPMPGSLYAHNWRQKGISSVELIDKLIALAIKRHTDHQKYNTAFHTNYLKQF